MAGSGAAWRRPVHGQDGVHPEWAGHGEHRLLPGLVSSLRRGAGLSAGRSGVSADNGRAAAHGHDRESLVCAMSAEVWRSRLRFVFSSAHAGALPFFLYVVFDVEWVELSFF